MHVHVNVSALLHVKAIFFLAKRLVQTTWDKYVFAFAFLLQASLLPFFFLSKSALTVYAADAQLGLTHGHLSTLPNAA